MQAVAILILVAIGTLIGAFFLREMATDVLGNVWGIFAGACFLIALISGIICFLCLVLYAVGAGTPELNQGFLVCLALFTVSLTLGLLVAKKKG